jgi:hypothetical protein
MKLYLEPGSINCTCCPDISTCNNLEQAETTTMPDVIWANYDEVGNYWLMHNPDPSGELNRGDTRYTRADLVPDVADLVAALEQVNHLNKNSNRHHDSQIHKIVNKALARHARTQGGE